MSAITPARLWRLVARDPAARAALLIFTLTAAEFAIVSSSARGLLLPAMPFTRVDRLVQIWESNSKRGLAIDAVAPANLRDIDDRLTVFERFGFYAAAAHRGAATRFVPLTTQAGTHMARGLRVSTNLFEMLGASPMLGRGFIASDAHAGAPAHLIASHRLWQVRLGQTPSAIGALIDVDGTPHRVVGVMPPGFQLPGAEADYWIAYTEPPQFWNRRRAHLLRVIGVVKQGVRAEDVQRELDSLSATLEREYPATNTAVRLHAQPLRAWVTADLRAGLPRAVIITLLLLVIGLVNAAVVGIALANERAANMRVKIALGCPSLRLWGGTAAEMTAIATLAAFAGALLALAALNMLRLFVPVSLPQLAAVQLTAADTGVALLASFSCALSTSIAFALRGRGLQRRGLLTRFERARLHWPLLAAHVTCAVAFAVPALALCQSVARLYFMDSGLRPERAATMTLRLSNDPAAGRLTLNAVLESVRGSQGVESAGAISQLPFEGPVRSGEVHVEGSDTTVEAKHKEASEGYFAAAGLTILAGDDFGAATAAEAIAVNAALARRYWPDARDAIGRRVRFGTADPWRTIVAVTADERQESFTAPIAPMVYEPHAAVFEETMHVVARGDRAAVITALQRAGTRAATAAVIHPPSELRVMFDRAATGPRFLAGLFAGLALLALVLSTTGVCALIRLWVHARRLEIAVRSAVGATRLDIARLIARSLTAPTSLGAVVGGLTGFTALQSVKAWVDGMPDSDLGAFAAALLIPVLAMAAFVALLIRRAIGSESWRLLKS